MGTLILVVVVALFILVLYKYLNANNEPFD
jgi:hypothetical protein